MHGSTSEPDDRDWLLAIAANAQRLGVEGPHHNCTGRWVIDLSERPSEVGWVIEGWSEYREYFHMAATWHTWVLRFHGRPVAWLDRDGIHVAEDIRDAAMEAKTAIQLVMDPVTV